TLFIVDDADLGPVAAWMEALRPRRVVLLGRSMEDFSFPPVAAGGRREILPPLTEREKADLLERVFGSPVPPPLQEWGKRTEGNPRRWVLEARDLLRSGALRREKGRWVYDPVGLIREPSESNREKIRKILARTRVSLDPETLAGFVGVSVQEVEEELQGLAKEEEAERTIRLGRVQYRFRASAPSTPSAFPEAIGAPPKEILKLLD